MFITSFTTTAPDFLRMRAYGVMFIATSIMFVFFAWDSTWNEDAFEMAIFLIATVATLGIAIYRVWFSTWGAPSADLWVLFIMTALSLLPYIFLCVRLMRQFGWRIASIVGCDAKIQRMYRYYRILVALIKLDFFFHVILAVIAAFFFPLDLELLAIGLGMTYFFLWCLLGWYGFSREKWMLMVSFFLGSIVTPPYIVYKLYRILTDTSHLESFPVWVGCVSVAITLLAHIACLAVAAKCYLNVKRAGNDSLWQTRQYFSIQQTEQ